MLQPVDVGERALGSYEGVAPAETLASLRAVAAGLRGLRVLHLNATPYGGGVAELLRSGVPLLSDLGLVADWKIISGEDRFFDVTKAIHNGLQGAARTLTEDERAAYLHTSEINAALLEEEYDFVFVHDPQPAAIPSLRGTGGTCWVWRCHIDTASPNAETWAFIRPFLSVYDAAVFTLEEFVPPDFPIERVEIIPPAIDPLSPKNRALDETTAREILDWIGVEADRPLVTQISRFDPWKDPLGVIAAYRQARESVPELQLALAGSMALDDPEGWYVYREITAAAGDDPLIHVFTNLTGVGNIEVNAFQRVFRRRGAEVDSRGLRSRRIRGDVEGDPGRRRPGRRYSAPDGRWRGRRARRLGRGVRSSNHPAPPEPAGGDRARRAWSGAGATSLLLPRLLLNELLLVDQLVGRERSTAVRRVARRDPVSGMVVDAGAEAGSERYGESDYVFCSRACQLRFQRRPERYAGRQAGQRRNARAVQAQEEGPTV